MLHERLDERSLADPRLSGHKYQPVLTRQSLVQIPLQPVQHALPPHQGCSRRRGGLSQGLGRQDRHGSDHRSDRGDKPIAPPRLCLDIPRRLRVILQDLAQQLNGSLQHPLAHTPPSPDGIEQLLLGHQPPGMCGQITEHGKGLGRQRQGLLSPPKLGVDRVQTIGTKIDRVG
ncbi:MAG: hypothetical protein M3255_03975 [Pseudomonadota bacterium]|nr:hypothetical protein [Pseudomonadota bacterium]